MFSIQSVAKSQILGVRKMSLWNGSNAITLKYLKSLNGQVNTWQQMIAILHSESYLYVETIKPKCRLVTA